MGHANRGRPYRYESHHSINGGGFPLPAMLTSLANPIFGPWTRTDCGGRTPSKTWFCVLRFLLTMPIQNICCLTQDQNRWAMLELWLENRAVQSWTRFCFGSASQNQFRTQVRTRSEPLRTGHSEPLYWTSSHEMALRTKMVFSRPWEVSIQLVAYGIAAHTSWRSKLVETRSVLKKQLMEWHYTQYLRW